MAADEAGFREKYGRFALVAGASEGLGAAFARQIAARGLDLVLIARRAAVLESVAVRIGSESGVEVRTLAADLADPEIASAVSEATEGLEVGLLVYNAAHSAIGPFLDTPLESHLTELDLNCRTALVLTHLFGRPMRERGRGGILLMSSLAGSQGSPYVANYGATKAYDRVLAEGLWGELGEHGVDVVACCAGATRTPRYLAGRPGDKRSYFVPEMEPEDVAREALAALGRRPSLVPGRANRAASFFMAHLLPRRLAIRMMGSATRGMEGD